MPARMRFPAQALEELRREDPGTQVTLHYIRRLAATGRVPYVLIGRRRLLNYDALVAYLADPVQEAPQPGIRPIDERTAKR